MLDASEMDSCTLDVLDMKIGTDRPTPNPADNFNGTLRLPSGTATVGNAGGRFTLLTVISTVASLLSINPSLAL